MSWKKTLGLHRTGRSVWLGFAALLLGAAGTAHASNISWSVGVQSGPAVVYGAAPTYVAPAPVYVAPPVRYHAPAPRVVYAPPPPVMLVPAPPPAYSWGYPHRHGPKRHGHDGHRHHHHR